MEPRVISFVNTKGGVGKTTSALLTAIAFVQQGRTVTVLDMDPQGSATDWARIAAEDGTPLPFNVLPANLATLRGPRPTSNITIIDTPPGAAPVIDAAVEASDVVVIPTSPGLMDTDRTWETAGATASSVPTYVLVTRYDARTPDGRNLLNALDAQGVGRFETVIPARVALQRSRGTLPNPTTFSYDTFTTELQEIL